MKQSEVDRIINDRMEAVRLGKDWQRPTFDEVVCGIFILMSVFGAIAVLILIGHL